MSDSSDESLDFDVPYSSRPEWADIQPVDQDGETSEIVRIAYTETFKEVYGYFRAILKLNEKSERAFELTRDVALLNPANYTVWHFRRLLIKELAKSLPDELAFITSVINSHPKNYQVWQHRRHVVECMQDASQELAFTQRILKKDSKNYHAWQFRQWAIKTFALWSDELAYIEQLIDEDVRNNSAWNQRYFVVRNTSGGGGGEQPLNESLDVLKRELDFATSKIALCVDNESSWNYLRAMWRHVVELKRRSKPADDLLAEVDAFCRRRLESATDDDRSPFLISFVVEMNKERLLSSSSSSTESDDESAQQQQLVEQSVELLDSLAAKYDVIRANYWNYQKSIWTAANFVATLRRQSATAQATPVSDPHSQEQ